jgi:hypothetical protein
MRPGTRACNGDLAVRIGAGAAAVASGTDYGPSGSDDGSSALVTKMPARASDRVGSVLAGSARAAPEASAPVGRAGSVPAGSVLAASAPGVVVGGADGARAAAGDVGRVATSAPRFSPCSRSSPDTDTRS